MKATYTREEILQAMALEPCHITGMHDPSHTGFYVCEKQRAAAYANLCDFLGVEVGDVPRKKHEDCGWCNNKKGREDVVAGYDKWVKEGIDQDNASGLLKAALRRAKSRSDRELEAQRVRRRYSVAGLRGASKK